MVRHPVQERVTLPVLVAIAFLLGGWGNQAVAEPKITERYEWVNGE